MEIKFGGDILGDLLKTADRLSNTHGEFSDIGAGGPDLAEEKTSASPALQVGESAMGRLPGGATVRGEITRMEDGHIWIQPERGPERRLPETDVKSQEQVDADAMRTKERDRKEEEEAQRVVTEEMEKFRQQLIDKYTQKVPTGTYDQLANYLLSTGYKLKLDVSPEQEEEFANTYQELTGEELHVQSRPKSKEHATKGGWTVEFPDTPDVRRYVPWPIDVARTNLQPMRGEGNERATTDGKTIKVMYNRPVWELIKRGLRYTGKDQPQEVRTMASEKKQACEGCGCSPEEAVLPTSKAIPGPGAVALPPARVDKEPTPNTDKPEVPNAEKEAAGGFKPMPAKGSPEWHQLKICMKTFQMNPAMLGVMGGPGIEEATKVLAEYGIVPVEKDGKTIFKHKNSSKKTAGKCTACGHVSDDITGAYCSDCKTKRKEQKEKGGEVVGDFSGKEADASSQGSGQRWALWTGPVAVKEIADKLRQGGIKVTVEGTEKVYFETDDKELAPLFHKIKKILGPNYGLKSKDFYSYGSAEEGFWKGHDQYIDDMRKNVTEQNNAAEAASKEAGFNFFFPGQVVKEFYPELQHEIVDYPNDTNSPMIEEIDVSASGKTSGDTNAHCPFHNPWNPECTECAEAFWKSRKSSFAIEAALETTVLSYVSTSPSGAVGIGRDGKPQVLDGAPLRKENDIRGGMFMDEFHQQYDGVPGALLVVEAKVAAADEKHQFELFLKKVMGEIAATMVAAFKVTSRPLLNQVPGVGEVQLAQVEQPSSLSTFNLVNTGSRVKYLLDKLNDGDIREAVNAARAQGAVWLDDANGGFVYEVFVRAESIDTDTMIMKYTFITGTKETGE